jgi:hypothetical protein
LGVPGSIKCNSFDATNSIGTSHNPSAFASTSTTHETTTFGEQTNKRKKYIAIKKVFKEEWVAQFPWVEPIVNLTSKIHMVCCNICSLVEGNKKLINPKLDGLQKHVRKRKTLTSHPQFLVRDHCINNDSQQ